MLIPNYADKVKFPSDPKPQDLNSMQSIQQAFYRMEQVITKQAEQITTLIQLVTSLLNKIA